MTDPRKLYADLLADLANLGQPPRCQHYMDDSDFEEMGAHLQDVIGRLQTYVANVGTFCAENSYEVKQSEFAAFGQDQLSDMLCELSIAAEKYRVEHQQAAESGRTS